MTTQTPVTDGETLVLQKREGRVATVTLNRPHRKNALTPALNGAVIDALRALAADPEIGCVILTGAGGSFSSGLDLKDAMTLDPTTTAETAEVYFNGMIRAVRECPKPVIAAVDGPAVGFGMGLAMAADIRIASDKVRFSQSFLRIGLIPDGGSTWLLQRLVGQARALELILTTDEIHADEALRAGLVSKVVPQAELEAAALALATRLAAGPPRAMAVAKSLVLAAQCSTLEEALKAEMAAQMGLLQTADFMEGVTAFMMKRPPQFRGE